MDANAYACAVKPAEKSLGVVIRSAQWMGQGVKPAVTTHAVSVIDNEAPTETDEQTTSVETALPLAASSCAVPDGGVETESPPALPEPPAAAMPAPPPEAEPQHQVDERQVMLTFGERRYRVRGLPKQLTEALKVNVLVTLIGASPEPASAAPDGGAVHVDTLDLYHASASGVCLVRGGRARGADHVLQGDLGRLLLTLEQVIRDVPIGRIALPTLGLDDRAQTQGSRVPSRS